MQSVWRRLVIFVAGLAGGLVIAAAPTRPDAPTRPAAGDSSAPLRLSFDVDEGLNLNSFLRDGPVAAHLLLRAGLDPRILVAFPAGNSGTGLWFAHGPRAVTWTLRGRPQPLVVKDAKGRSLYGVTAEVIATGAKDLYFKQAVLSSVRVLRDYQALGTFPAEIAAAATRENSTISWARDRLDGAAGYRLSIEVTRGTLHADHVTAAGADAVGDSAIGESTIGLTITALCGEIPLTPLSGEDLLNEHAGNDLAARQALTFLSYREKFLAGSWRFDTYFGRDTLMSLRLLMPALAPQAVNAGLGAVLTRLSPKGEVAHEEDIGEFAILDHLHAAGKPDAHQSDAPQSDAPIFDYKMVDGSFMLAPVAAAWLLDDARGRAQARDFVARRDDRRGEPDDHRGEPDDHRGEPDGRPGEATRTMGADLVSNLKFVLKAAAAFAQDPRASNLIALKSGIPVGQWRDSNDGLAGGRVAYDVNAVFVPAALEAAGRFFASGLLEPVLDAADRGLFERAMSMAEVWRAKAGPLFDVSVSSVMARRSIAAYAAGLSIPDGEALRSVGDVPVRFHALSLDADAKPIPVLNSDEGFDFLFGRPDAAALTRAVTALMRPFPAGLLTPVGVVVANPVYATPPIQAMLPSSAYHGTVIWSWQQAVLAAGLQRQLQRQDLPPSLHALLRRTQRQLWVVIRAAHAMRNSELWSWTFAGNQFQVAPFGAHASDADESNAAQLWSTVYLAIPDPLLSPRNNR